MYVMQIHPSAGHLVDTSQLHDSLHIEPYDVIEEVRGAAAGDQLEADVHQPTCELLQAGLVVDGDQCAQSSLTTSGRIRCSTSWIRSTRVARGSTATGCRRMTVPVSRPSST